MIGMKSGASIIIPAYNESKTVPKVLEQLGKDRYEIIVIDDGSSDGTGRIVKEMGFRCIVLERNRGKGHACIRGIKEAGSNNIVIFDADNQFDSADIPKMLDALENSDMVIGERKRKNIPLQRRLSNGFAAWVVNRMTGEKLRDVLCGFRAIRKDKFMELGMEKDTYEFESEMVIKAARKGLRISSVPINVRYFSGASGISPMHSAKVTIYILKELIKSWVQR